MGINECVKNEDDVVKSFQYITQKGLDAYVNFGKSWYFAKAIKFIEDKGKGKDSLILDAGSGSPSAFLLALRHLGYKRLYGCDIRLVTGLRSLIRFLYFNLLLKIKISRQDSESTTYKNRQFDFIVSLTVVQSGIDLSRFFSEANRILKAGGYLIICTDYWPVRDIDSGQLDPHDKRFGKAKYFNKSDIENMVGIAENYGLFLVEPIDFEVQERSVHYLRNQYTFIFLVMEKRITGFYKQGQLESSANKKPRITRGFC